MPCRISAALRSAATLVLCLALGLPAALAETARSAPIPNLGNAAVHPVHLIVGFMGGRVRPDNLLHKEATMAQDLRNAGAHDLHVLVFANHNGGSALRSVLALLDQDGDRFISDAERGAAHIAIYGHSWGASETVALARALQKQGIPIAITIQVDSVQKHGEDDGSIPANVQNAVNLYQRDGLLRGRAAIHAEDTTRTHILINQQVHYGPRHQVDIAPFPWFARTFMRQHIMIENDPEVWGRVEAFLKAAMQDSNAKLAEEPLRAVVTGPVLIR